jgi:RNA polymerase primary sigma factor
MKFMDTTTIYKKDIKRYRNKDNKDLVTRNLPFVILVAGHYKKKLRKPYTVDDLICAGNEGIIEAANRYDESRGVKFISYAAHWIKQSIQNFLNNQYTVHMPANEIEHRLRLNRMGNTNFKGKDKIKEECKRKDYLFSEFLQSYETIDNFGNSEKLQDDEITSRMTLNQLFEMIKNKRELDIVKMYFVDGLTMEEIANDCGITRSRVQQIVTSALNKIRMRLSPDTTLEELL